MACIIKQFRSPPLDYSLARNAVHVWRAYFQPVFMSNGKFAESLSAEEIDRAQRFIRKSDQDRYVFAHGVLRSVLGAYLGCAPHKLIFENKQYYKPRLVSHSGGNDIQFNLSHSGDMILIAVTRGPAVGIDVEHMRRIPDVLQIVNRFFSADERELLNTLSSEDFDEGFFTYWTSKEAFLKGMGKGLSYPLDKFSIIFPNEGSAGVIYVHDDPINAHCWKIIRLSPGPGYSGALAIEELRSEPEFFDYCRD